MSSNGNQPEQPTQPPQPDPAFAIQSLHEEVQRLRTALSQADDTRVYLNAMLNQMQSEAQAEIARLAGELSKALVPSQGLEADDVG